MERSVIIVGNGMGMAIDPEYFKLSSAIESVWHKNDYLEEEHKNLISSAIKGVNLQKPPQSEDQLETLQTALIATGFLNNLEVNRIEWLSRYSRELPRIFNKFIHEVALYFHNSGHELPEHFAKPFSNYIHETKSHVLTLNYDCLLYNDFINRKVLDGYSGALIDGFRRDGFSDEYLSRLNKDDLGWYFHLHGSPLFIENKKMTGSNRFNIDAEDEGHIVLTYVKHKPMIISKSEILSTYWRRMETALEESDNIILFGYSGFDLHLNKVIKSRRLDKSLSIIEWDNPSETFSEREQFWKRKTGFSEINLIRKNNILDFSNWFELFRKQRLTIQSR